MSNIMIFSAGIQVPSSSTKLANIYADLLTKQGHLVTLVELRETAKETTEALLLGFAPPKLDMIMEKFYDSDGAVFVVPTYNASFNALFKSFVDIVDPERVVNMPVAVSGTGGTPRHSLVFDYAIKPIFNHLHMPVAEYSTFVATDDWGGGVSNIRGRVEKNVEHFLHLVNTQLPAPVQNMSEYLNSVSFP